MTLELFLQIVAAGAVVVGGYWALAKLLIAQINRGLDQRFDAQEEARKNWQKAWHERLLKIEAKQDELEKDVRRILIELPREYVNRGDYVRRETIIEGKIDQLGLRIQNWILERGNAA